MASRFGTAPRRISPGNWRTRSGRQLTPAQATVWETYYRLGHTDGLGHFTKNTSVLLRPHGPVLSPSTATVQPAQRVKKPSFRTALAAKRGDRQALAQVQRYEQHQQAKRQGQEQAQTLQDRALFGASLPVVQAASKVANPVASALVEGLSPSTALEEAGAALRRGNLPAAGLAAASILPVGRGAGLATGVERAVKAERAAARALQIGELLQELPSARSPITRALIEKPADALSRLLPNLPYAGSRARATKAAGRLERVEQQRQRLGLIEHVHALPRKGSNLDVAHFWWAQLPASERNVGGLVKVRDALQAELDSLTGGAKYVSRRRTAKAAAGKVVEARNLAASIKRLNRVIASRPVHDESVTAAVHALSGDRARILKEHDLLSEGSEENRPGIVSRYLGLEPTGEEAYIGHRLGKVRGAGGVRSIGTGRPANVQGLQANTMKLLRSGSLRQSTHVAAEDWNATQTYQDLKRIRHTLWQMGDKFEGHVPDGYLLVNPHGKVIPPEWKHDVVAELEAGHEGLADEVKNMLKGFVSDRSTWRATVEKAKEAGQLNDLRIVPEKDVRRFYSQFLPAGSRTPLGKAYDTGIDAMANSLIFARAGYLPKNVAQSLVMAVPHQGVRLFANAPRAAQLVPHPGSSALDRKLWDALVHESGAGVSGIVAQETYRKALGKVPALMTKLADQPARVSAFLHEAANEGVIPKYAVHLSDEDKRALLSLVTDEDKRPLLNQIMQRTRDAMGDFERLTPAQRRIARRLFIVPGWLTAGTRYPIHFAATHPVRSAVLGYAAAGEPGSPKKLNRPVTDYLVKGLPSYIQAVPGGKGKIERVQSVLPAAIPADVGIALASGAPIPEAAGYINPLAEATWNVTHGVRGTSTGETQKVGYLRALEDALRGLAPAEQELQRIAAPSTDQSKVYPDHSRLGELERAAGVLPVRYDPRAALQAQYRERGMRRSLGVAKDRQAFEEAFSAAGFGGALPADLQHAYDLKQARAERLDRIHSHGPKLQREGFTADVQLAVERGLLDKAEAARALNWARKASDADVAKARRWMGDNYFGGRLIRDSKRYLHSR